MTFTISSPSWHRKQRQKRSAARSVVHRLRKKAVSNYISSAPTALFAIPSPTTSHSTPLQAAIEIDEQYELEYVIERMESERNQQIMASPGHPSGHSERIEVRSKTRQNRKGQRQSRICPYPTLLCNWKLKLLREKIKEHKRSCPHL